MMDKTTEITEKTLESDEKNELLRHLHILDALAYDLLEAQLKFLKRAICHKSNHSELRQIISKKYMWFEDAKRNFLNSNGFIDNPFETSDKDEVNDIITRCNISRFFNLLFVNFDPNIPDLPNVDYNIFFNYIVPPNLAQSEEIWDLELDFRVQIYIYELYKNPQKRDIKSMFPEEVEGSPTYQETYRKVRHSIKNYSGDVEKLMKKFKWKEFSEKMYNYMFNIANGLNKPLLHKYTSSGSTRAVVEGASQKEADNNATSDNLGDSFYRNEEVEKVMSNVIDQISCTPANQSNLLLNIDESSTSALSQGTRQVSDNNASLMKITKQTSSSSIVNQLSEQLTVDDRQSSSEESSTEQNSSYEQVEGSSRKRKKRAIYNLNTYHERATKRVKNMWNKKELSALELGMRKYGKSWANIKKDYGSKGQILESRSQTQLKDKARSEFLRRLRERIEPGVFGIMDN